MRVIEHSEQRQTSKYLLFINTFQFKIKERRVGTFHSYDAYVVIEGGLEELPYQSQDDLGKLQTNESPHILRQPPPTRIEKEDFRVAPLH